MSVLVVAAHPDDEVLGAGGTIARLADEGESVHVLILGEGATSRGGEPEPEDADVPAEVLALEGQARRAGAILGAATVSFGRLPDNRFDGVDLLAIVQRIERTIAEVEPIAVFCQHGGDANIDHRRTFEAVVAATRPQPGSRIRSVLSFEVNSSTEWAFDQFKPTFTPSVYFDITGQLERKMSALREYEHELRPWPHPRSIQAVEANARVRGCTVGVEAAEAFSLVWERR